MERKKVICTAKDPYDESRIVHEKGVTVSVEHPDAVGVGEQEDGYPGGDIVKYACPHCKTRFSVELPQ